mgnify:CR=1 FL=1
MKNAWTQPEMDHVKSAWAKGYSASQISRTVSATFGNNRTRNAVIGIVHRMGLDQRSVPTRPVRIKPRRKRVIPVLKAKQKPASEPNLIPPAEPEMWEPEGAFDILDLKPHQCRWPVSTGDDHKFCGKTQTTGSSYCREHMRRSVSIHSASTLMTDPVTGKAAK